MPGTERADPAAAPDGGAVGRTALLGASLAIGAGAYAIIFRADALAALGPLRNLAATLLALLPYAAAVAFFSDVARPSRRELALLFVGLALLRLCIPLDLLEGSDDAYRYLWDGLVQSHGINPYAHAPQDAALAPLRDARFFGGVYRPDMRTVYPPLAELWFRLAYWISPRSFAGLKLILLAHELASCALLLALLRRMGRPAGRALIYAWSPLAVVQLFSGAHLDGLLVPWCLLALLLAERRPLFAGAALALAASVRPLLLLGLPALLGRRPLREAAAVAAGCAAAAGLLLSPFLSAGRLMVESLLVYAQHWRFNGSLFRLAEAALGWRRGRQVVYGAAALGGLASGWLPPRADRPTRLLLALSIYLALAPTVYPWYLLPLIALGAAVVRGPLIVALPALVGLSDLVFVQKLTTGRWEVPPEALGLEYGLLGCLLALELLARRSAGPASPRPDGARPS